jgi:predicted nuclease with RNAse H fold
VKHSTKLKRPHSYRIRICDTPESSDKFRKYATRAEQIANVLSRRSVHVTETKPTHVRCETSFDIDAVLSLLLSLDVKREDVTQER